MGGLEGGKRAVSEYFFFFLLFKLDIGALSDFHLLNEALLKEVFPAERKSRTEAEDPIK